MARLQQRLHLKAVHACCHQQMKILQNADILRTHDMGAIDILINRIFLVLAFGLDEKQTALFAQAAVIDGSALLLHVAVHQAPLGVIDVGHAMDLDLRFQLKLRLHVRDFVHIQFTRQNNPGGAFASPVIGR